ncbi:MAG: uroporphyrinogen-III synthase [Porticoccaceae bacterium]|nr:uroporphyrinogen-III synthase [Porticoccaceae bacterium]
MMDHADKNSLAAKRLLLIRPQRQDDQLLTMLENKGAEVTHYPVMSIQAVVESPQLEQKSPQLEKESPQPEPKSQKIKDQILELDNFHKAIVVSGNAAELSLEWIDKYWPMFPVGIDYFAVGERTAELLKQAGIDALHPRGRQNSEELLKLEPLQELDNQRIIIFRGVGGREILGETLIERGARVEYCELYKRVINSEQLALAQQQETDCLIAHSGELIQAMGEAGKAADTPVVVPSERVAAIARDLGYRQVFSAKNALPESMLAAVHKAFS